MVAHVQEGADLTKKDLFAPPSAGEFLDQTFRRKNLSFSDVAAQTGISEKNLSELVSGERKFSLSSCKKLEAILPNASQVLMGIQGEREFYDTYGVIRPEGFVRRMLVIIRGPRK
jgi:plasmid maintenance system antidote protein VapI